MIERNDIFLRRTFCIVLTYKTVNISYWAIIRDPRRVTPETTEGYFRANLVKLKK